MCNIKCYFCQNCKTINKIKHVNTGVSSKWRLLPLCIIIQQFITLVCKTKYIVRSYGCKLCSLSEFVVWRVSPRIHCLVTQWYIVICSMCAVFWIDFISEGWMIECMSVKVSWKGTARKRRYFDTDIKLLQMLQRFIM